MKTVIGLAAALALTFSAGPATAGDMFRALSPLPAGERARLTLLDDEQLAAVEGENLENLLALVQLLISTATDHAAMLASQILFLIQVQLKTKPTATVQRNVMEVIQSAMAAQPPGSGAVQLNVVEVTQRQGNTVSSTRQSMW
jgi:hypothetical protein